MAAGRLAAGDPGHPLTLAIEQFVLDGGVTALRALLSDHVRRHGAQLKVAGLIRRSARLKQLVERFAAADRPRTYAGAPRLFDDLLNGLSQAADDLVDAVEDLRVDTLRETLMPAVAAHVHRWPSWQATLATADGRRQRRAQRRRGGAPAGHAGVRRHRRRRRLQRPGGTPAFARRRSLRCARRGRLGRIPAAAGDRRSARAVPERSRRRGQRARDSDRRRDPRLDRHPEQRRARTCTRRSPSRPPTGRSRPNWPWSRRPTAVPGGCGAWRCSSS